MRNILTQTRVCRYISLNLFSLWSRQEFLHEVLALWKGYKTLLQSLIVQ